ncbi:PTS N-acetylmuramic acid transporter subunit IIBC [[Enterobacter] lignolyticus]|uniref:PTS system N-acetylmuramic acid-specific EIIBC component n=1 Tax=[Enterobacter] lignolyticus TaxID=1334193 RepID=A0A806X4T4_9ENTR|nr:PTS N-acetylmuramic acid transporter subunit IIBC [[Enterobacter] lignolyticus]ALR76468.1 PTS N-acetylmuramic acid transporter subunit IIBC [[Enterobacter] lignolyticus]
MSKTISKELLTQIITLAGGADNIINCGNCMTRLRLRVSVVTRIAPEIHTALKGAVSGVVINGNEVQIIFGVGKAQRAAESMNNLLGVKDLNAIAAENKNQLKSKQQSSLQQFLANFATIFTPLIPGFIAAGLMLGIATLVGTLMHIAPDAKGVMPDSLNFLKIFSKGLFTFLVVLIGYNAQKAFGGTGVNGAIIAALFILGYNPTATVGYYSGLQDFFGHVIDPRGNIIGVLLAAWAGAKIERFFRRYIPDELDMILTSMLTLIVTAIVTFIIIMPVGVWLFQGMSWLFMHLNSNPLGCAVLAGVFLIAVVFGVHQGFIPVYLALMDSQGFNSLFPILSMAGAGQVGAALALYWRSEKTSTLRSQIRGAIIPGLLGVGEPLIYGVTLPRMKPFVTACVGGAAGGLFIGTVAWLGLPVGLNSAFGPSGLVALPLMTSGSGILPAIAVYGGGVLISYVAGFVITALFGCKNVDLD